MDKVLIYSNVGQSGFPYIARTKTMANLLTEGLHYSGISRHFTSHQYCVKAKQLADAVLCDFHSC